MTTNEIEIVLADHWASEAKTFGLRVTEDSVNCGYTRVELVGTRAQWEAFVEYVKYQHCNGHRDEKRSCTACLKRVEAALTDWSTFTVKKGA